MSEDKAAFLRSRNTAAAISDSMETAVCFCKNRMLAAGFAGGVSGIPRQQQELYHNTIKSTVYLIQILDVGPPGKAYCARAVPLFFQPI
ncbi:hypothetical protein H9Q10_11450 [Eikenella sp. S3360]|uniref:Uncharacterized protein n=1 Tax=Eikenella glucosivorans TaxID=2766967 RepID=A0ABS0ND70_9NEIS|nr:hypothetical protein [Eikenella glucosivorans]